VPSERPSDFAILIGVSQATLTHSSALTEIDWNFPMIPPIEPACENTRVADQLIAPLRTA
jgi:hypothetical protein